MAPFSRVVVSAGANTSTEGFCERSLRISSGWRWSLCLCVMTIAETFVKFGKMFLNSTGSQRIVLPSFSIATPECSSLVIFII